MSSVTVIKGKKKSSAVKTYVETAIAPIEKKEETTVLDMSKYVETAKELYDVALTIFDKELLHIADNRLYIRYPLLEITNSKRHKHTIRDIIVRLHINKSTSGHNVSIQFDGMRLTYEPIEVQNNYHHSHLPGSTGYGRFGNFCLGSSDFAIIRQNTMLEPTIANWILLLMAIEPYLSWESLEGGPHMRIENIRERQMHIPYSLIEDEALRLCGEIPDECIDPMTPALIDNVALSDYYNKNSRIRKSYVTDYDEQSTSTLKHTITRNGKGIKWNDGILEFNIVNTKDDKKKPSESIDPSIKSELTGVINTRLHNFKELYQHEQRRKEANRPRYTLGQTKADRDRNTPKADRPTTRSGTRR